MSRDDQDVGDHLELDTKFCKLGSLEQARSRAKSRGLDCSHKPGDQESVVRKQGPRLELGIRNWEPVDKNLEQGFRPGQEPSKEASVLLSSLLSTERADAYKQAATLMQVIQASWG